MNRQPTLPVLFICGETEDNNIDKKETQTWYRGIFNIMCWHMRKKWCIKNRMQLAELTPQLIIYSRVRI